jgi:hypothetical protein
MKRLILLSDLDGEFGDDQIDTVIAGIKKKATTNTMACLV